MGVIEISEPEDTIVGFGLERTVDFSLQEAMVAKVIVKSARADNFIFFMIWNLYFL
jgi:hypothetical protein